MEQLTFDQLLADDTAPGLCACGCGEPTPLAKFTNRAYGIVAGQPTRYLKGHKNRRRIDENGRECCACGEYKPWGDFHLSRTTRYGHMTVCKPCTLQSRKAATAARKPEPRIRSTTLCGCGCGEFTFLSAKDDRARGRLKGEPSLYLQDHFKRGKHPEKSRDVPPPKPRPLAKSRQPDYLRPDGGNFKRNYGITYDQYVELVIMQCGACAICGAIPSEDPDSHKKTNKLVIDHDHGTGKVRGLLCSRCNLMLGHSRDEPARLRAGAEYLTGWAA